MKNIITEIIFISFLTLSSCSHKSILFGVKQKYFLHETENLAQIDSIALKEYEPLRDSIIQLPLNRFIIADNYKLFIALCLTNKIDDVVNLYKQKFSQTLIAHRDTTIKKINFDIFLFSCDSSHYLSIIFWNKNTFYPAVMTYKTNNLDLLKSFFEDYTFIEKKLKL